MPDTVSKEVEVLYGLYQVYLEAERSREFTSKLGEKMAIAERKKGKEQSQELQIIQKYFSILETVKEEISDGMTFRTPLIWIQYKRYAYRGQSTEIRTVKDFIAHCTPEGYICTKRFHFLNTGLIKLGYASFESVFPSDMLLSDVESHLAFVRLLQSKEFIEMWKTYEYYMENDKSKKWKLYTGV
jgi:hypothetical protein